MLEDIKKSYRQSANNISGWQTMDKNLLANLYLKYEHKEPEKSYYFSALMLRYWKNVYKFYKTSRSARLEISDFTSWLAESFFVAFKYRRWTDPNNKLYNDPQGPDKVINRCIYSTRMRYYQYYNMDKRKINYITDSIDRQIETFGQTAEVYKLLSTDDIKEDDDHCLEVINHLISKGLIFNSIVVDLICYGDTFRGIKTITRVNAEDNDSDNITTKDEKNDDESQELNSDDIDDEDFSDLDIIESDNFENNDDEENIEDFEEEKQVEVKMTKKISYRYEFSLRKLMTQLRQLEDNYVNYFSEAYHVEPSDVIHAIEKIKDLDDRKQLSRFVNKVISSLSKDKKVVDILC